MDELLATEYDGPDLLDILARDGSHGDEVERRSGTCQLADPYIIGFFLL